MQKKVSVALATYNGEEYLREQLDSLCSQEMLPYEIVASDDCSSDSTIKILMEYMDRLNIRIIQSENNLGVNKNFERAIRTCSGDYIMICDQDDIWFPEKIKVSFDRMHSIEEKFGTHKPLLVSSGTIPFTGTLPAEKTINYKDGIVTDTLSFILENVYNQGCTLMFNHTLLEHLKPFPNSFREMPYDYYIALVGTFIGERCHICRPLMFYRNHSHNVFGKAVNYSKKDLIKLKISNISFSLFKCKQSDMPGFELVKLWHGNEVKNEIVENVWDSCLLYFKANNIIQKAGIIARMKGVSIKDKIKQIVILFLTMPFRLYLRMPFSIN